MRQPRDVRNPQSNDSERTPQIGPTLKRLLCSSTYAAINTVSGRARPRKKPTPSSKSRSPDAIPRSRPAAPQLRHRVLGRLPRLLRDRRARLVAPTPQRFRRHPRILRHRGDRVRLRRIRGTRFRQQPDGLRLELRRISSALCHGSIISHRVRGNTEQKSVHITWKRTDNRAMDGRNHICAYFRALPPNILIPCRSSRPSIGSRRGKGVK